MPTVNDVYIQVPSVSYLEGDPPLSIIITPLNTSGHIKKKKGIVSF